MNKVITLALELRFIIESDIIDGKTEESQLYGSIVLLRSLANDYLKMNPQEIFIDLSIPLVEKKELFYKAVETAVPQTDEEKGLIKLIKEFIYD